MFSKSLFCFSLLALFCSDSVLGEENWAVRDYIDGEIVDVNESREKDEILLSKELNKPACDVPICSLIECDEAGPPPFCPRNVTICRSGCACISYCKDENSVIYCYQVKYCRTPRRFSPDIFTTRKLDLNE